MKQFKLALAFICICAIAISCNQNTDESNPAKAAAAPATEAMPVKVDPAQLKKEVQEMETAWAAADNARDVNTLASYYADDAISLASDQPMLVGNAAIKKNLEASLAKRPKGRKVSYEVMDVYGSDTHVTEVGKTIRTDSTGKVTTTGKYMAIWEKRDGKWLCIRDIGNEDAKAK